MTDKYTLDVAFSLADEAPDTHHKIMDFGYSQSIGGDAWQRAGQRPGLAINELNLFDQLTIASSDATFGFSFYSNDDVQPDIGLIQFRPSISALVEGSPNQPETPLLINGEPVANPLILHARDFLSPTEGQSAGLNDTSFTKHWQVNYSLVSPPEGQPYQYEFLIALSLVHQGTRYYFKVDPELIIDPDAR